MATERPAAPPEAVLIAWARKGSGVTIADAAHAAGISVARWSQVENGYETRAGVTKPVRARPETIARMCASVHVTSDRLAAEGERPDAVPILREIERQDAAVQGHAASMPAASGFLAAQPGTSETELAQLRAIVEAAISRTRNEIAGHVGQVARNRGIYVDGPDDLDKLDVLDGAELYPGDAGINPRLARIWDGKDVPVADRFDLMSAAVVLNAQDEKSQRRTALPARIPAPRHPISIKVTERVARITDRT